MKLSRPDWLNATNVQIVLIVAIIIAVGFILNMIYSAPDPGAVTEKAIALERERTEKELEETKKQSELLQSQIDALNVEIKTLQAEIKESVKKREELHDAIGKARNIRDIDRILDGGHR